jgi:hypothetical protein
MKLTGGTPPGLREHKHVSGFSLCMRTREIVSLTTVLDGASSLSLSQLSFAYRFAVFFASALAFAIYSSLESGPVFELALTRAYGGAAQAIAWINDRSRSLEFLQSYVHHGL